MTHQLRVNLAEQSVMNSWQRCPSIVLNCALTSLREKGAIMNRHTLETVVQVADNGVDPKFALDVFCDTDL